MSDRNELYDSFLKRYPQESLPGLTLQEYTDLVPKESFCNWIESKLSELGSIWGSNSYKFGIYRYKNKPKENSRFKYDQTYAWLSKLGAADANSAFAIVRDALVAIARAASDKNLEAIEKIHTIDGMFKWKIAFLYSDKWLIPIYSRDWLKEICTNLGMPDGNKATIAQMMRFLIDRRGDKDPFEYYDELLALWNKMNSEKPQRVWLYSPGKGASQWKRCEDENIMCLGWDDIGDFASFSTIQEVVDEMRKVYNKPNGRFKNDSSDVWEFVRQIKPGDIIFAKNGLNRLLGRGIVTGEYEYATDADRFKNIRRVKWEKIGNWTVPHLHEQKMLTDISKYPDYVENLNHIIGEDEDAGIDPAAPEGAPAYWWLVASPKYWSFDSLKIGQSVEYTVVNEKGNKRRIQANFDNAKVGDLVIGYEANPVKKIVALAKVIKESDGNTISFEKTESLDAPVPWTAFKDRSELSGMEFIKNQNGSFFKVTEDEYRTLLELIRQDNPEPDESPIVSKESFEPYTKAQFLSEVFMTEQKLDELVELLQLKKNVILQGAPGVGKTFSAKRIAYYMMGMQNDSRIEMVQFHQNYSYEDFIMGYRPVESGGFELRKGVFYNFCKQAEKHPDKDFFFIIDEINRGNLSKIFGELLMLIENGYRDKPIKLAYSGEWFAVPGNLFIIGMMNTADRSLAMIDYALRRRFSFHTMLPGFDTDGFKAEVGRHSDPRVSKVVEAVVALNKTIADDDSLGDGFRIGHSYFCNQPADKPWIEHIVRYDLCPTIEEYWFDSKEKSEAEKERLLNLLK